MMKDILGNILLWYDNGFLTIFSRDVDNSNSVIHKILFWRNLIFLNFLIFSHLYVISDPDHKVSEVVIAELTCILYFISSLG